MLKSWPGLIAVILAIVSFYGMTYVVIALNMGWRFGYWLSGSVFGALMVMLSIMWIVNPVGPRGDEARWVPLAAGPDRIEQASLKDTPLTSPAEYPTGPWEAVEEGSEQADALTSAVTTCISTAPEKLGEEEKEPCQKAQGFMPPTESIPVIEGSAVAVSPESTDIRFATDQGALLGLVTVVPTTHDPRVAKDAIKGKAMGDRFLLLSVYNKGALRIPPLVSLLVFIIFTLIHMSGLNRAEKRKLSPTVA